MEAQRRGLPRREPGFRPVTLFDVSRQRVKNAAEVDLPATLPPTQLSPRQAARLDRAGAMLLLATREAWQQAELQPDGDLPMIFGTTAGGMSLGEAYFRQATQLPCRYRQQPSRALLYQPQVQARMVRDALGVSGSITIVSNACASGTNAIGHAWEMIRRGQTQRALTGGYDALSQIGFSGLRPLQSLSPTVCRPFDAHRDGLALGEGAAVITLESFESRPEVRRGILGEIIGYGA